MTLQHSDYVMKEKKNKETFMGSVSWFFTQFLNYEDKDSVFSFAMAQLFLIITNIIMIVPLLYLSLIPSPGTNFDAMMIILWISYAIFWFAMIIPTVASVYRRFSDAEIHHGFMFLWLIPFIGFYIVLLMGVLSPTQSPSGQYTSETTLEEPLTIADEALDNKS